jgi:acetoin:2,6-dichlorophenolindophenol oxidoreductase subunit alpha
VAKQFVTRAREGQPAFISIDCYRFYGHGRMDKSPYRTPEEEAAGRRQDPLLRLRGALEKEESARLDQIDGEASDEMNMALDFAMAESAPPLESMFEDVYGPGQPAPKTRAERLEEILG